MRHAVGMRAIGLVGADDAPVTADGKQIISVRGLLEWAFGTEYASLDYDEIGETAGSGTPGMGQEYRIMQQLALGKKSGEGVRVDTSFGRSHPHDDAEIVATVLRNSVEWSLAVRVAELARSGRRPQWDLGQQRLQPRDWSKRNHHGAFGKTEVCRTVKYTSRGRVRERKDLWVPCVWVPSAAKIAAAHRAYLDWWSALLSVLSGLQGVEFERFHLSERMPPMTPWKKTC